MGAAGRAVVGAIVGDTGLGAVIVGAAGATGGYLYGKHKEAEKRASPKGNQAGSRGK